MTDADARKERENRYRENLRGVRRMRWLKIGVSITGFGLLATVFLWQKLNEVEPGFMLSFSEMSAKGDQLQMFALRYQGTDKKGNAFTVTADTATQESLDSQEINLEGIQADITLVDGTWLNLSARSGLYRPDQGFLLLDGDVTIYSSTGYELHARSTVLELDQDLIKSDEPVSGQGPAGEFMAERFETNLDLDVLSFHGGVSGVLYPASR